MKIETFILQMITYVVPMEFYTLDFKTLSIFTGKRIYV